MDLHRQVQALYQDALTLRTKGRLADADQVEGRAAGLLEDLRNRVQKYPDDLETAGALLFLAEREWSIHGDAESIRTMIEQAVRIRENRLGREDPAVGEALGALAEFHFLAGRYGEAEPLYRRAVALCKNGGVSSVYAKCSGGLAQTLTYLGRRAEADPFFAKAIDLCGGSEDEKRVLYFLYIYRAEGLDQLDRGQEAEDLRRKANALLPRNNPGESGFHV